MVQAVDELGENYSCEIICDSHEVAPVELERKNIAVLRNIYSDEYTRKLSEADIVVIPTTSDDISSGQMVLLHSLAAARPVIISKTPTSAEYERPTMLQKLVEPQNKVQLKDAISELSQALPLSATARKTIRRLYEEKFSGHTHGRNVFNTLKHVFNFGKDRAVNPVHTDTRKPWTHTYGKQELHG